MLAMPKVIVIGAGIAGVSVAKKLAVLGHEVILIEQKDTILSGSSNDTPCRLGLGFHYNDLETAIRYLHATVDFLKNNPGYTVAETSHAEDPHKNVDYLKHWYYFFVKDSFYKFADVAINVYDKLKEEYIRLINADPANNVLGNPDDFYKELTVGQFHKNVNLDVVMQGVQTAEQVLDWPKYKRDTTVSIKVDPNIKLYTNTKVIDVKHHQDTPLFTVKTDTQNTFEAPFVINAAWQNIEIINDYLGVHYVPSSRSNRLKGIIEIDLNADEGTKRLINSPSMFFCFGAHCSFTNTGNGKGYLSFEPITNIEQSVDLELPELSQKLLDHKLTPEEWAKYVADFGKQILDGAENYIPGIKNAKIIGAKYDSTNDDAKFDGAKFGVVRIPSADVDIYSPDSDIHKRSESGVEATDIDGLIVDGAAKLLYGFKNADEVITILQKQAPILDANKILTSQSPSARKFNNITLSHIIKPVHQYTSLSLEQFTRHAPEYKNVIEAIEATIRPSREQIDLTVATEIRKRYSTALDQAEIKSGPEVDQNIPPEVKNLTKEQLDILNTRQFPTIYNDNLVALSLLSPLERAKEVQTYFKNVTAANNLPNDTRKFKQLFPGFAKEPGQHTNNANAKPNEDFEKILHARYTQKCLISRSPLQLKRLFPDFVAQLNINSLKSKYPRLQNWNKTTDSDGLSKFSTENQKQPEALNSQPFPPIYNQDLAKLALLTPLERAKEVQIYIDNIITNTNLLTDPQKFRQLFPSLANELGQQNRINDDGKPNVDFVTALGERYTEKYLRNLSPKQLKSSFPDFVAQLNIDSLKNKYERLQNSNKTADSDGLSKYSPENLKRLFANQLQDYSYDRLKKLSARDRVNIIRSRLEALIPNKLKNLRDNDLVTQIQQNLHKKEKVHEALRNEAYFVDPITEDQIQRNLRVAKLKREKLKNAKPIADPIVDPNSKRRSGEHYVILQRREQGLARENTKSPGIESYISEQSRQGKAAAVDIPRNGSNNEQWRSGKAAAVDIPRTRSNEDARFGSTKSNSPPKAQASPPKLNVFPGSPPKPTTLNGGPIKPIALTGSPPKPTALTGSPPKRTSPRLAAAVPRPEPTRILEDGRKEKAQPVKSQSGRHHFSGKNRGKGPQFFPKPRPDAQKQSTDTVVSQGNTVIRRSNTA